ncbi:MAG: ribonuclease III [bacterium]|nr:ribonuclease III [bacterium]
MFDRIREWLLGTKPVSAKDVPPELVELQRRLGYRFRDPALLRQALKHRSFLGQSGEARHEANERMEFLGDAVLDLIVSDYIYKRDVCASEGRLTQIKCTVVSGKSLARLSDELGLGEFILMSDGESRSGGRQRSSILEDVFEAVTAAIYLDGGFSAAQKFLNKVVLNRLDQLSTLEPFSNHKSELLEWAQDIGLGTPKYHVLQEEGPEHKKLFHVSVEIAGKPVAVGQGNSKKAAEQCAARVALETVQNQNGKLDDLTPVQS